MTYSAQAATTALPAIAPGMFAGLPRGRPSTYTGSSVRQFAGAPQGSFSQLPGRAGGLGSTAAADPDMQAVSAVMPVTVPNAQPPVPASTSLFLPALCNPDGNT